MRKLGKYLILFLLLTITTVFPNTKVEASGFQDETAIVHAVLFYSTNCGHCQKLITEDLPPILDSFGDQLLIIGINVASVQGQELYKKFVEDWNVPDEDVVVPLLVISDIYLIGGGEIPQELPHIVEDGLNEGGIDWPDLPGLEEVILQIETESNGESDEANPTGETSATPENTVQTTEVPTDSETGSPTLQVTAKDTQQPQNEIDSLNTSFDQEITFADRFKRDPTGNSLAVIVLIGMVISVISVLVLVLTDKPLSTTDWTWSIPILSILGLLVAGYLSFIEVSNAEAVCGPVGDCNSVQTSPYAVLLGFLPVGVLGFAGYAIILIGWILIKFGPNKWSESITLAVWGMALFGVIFSIYLTFLEPFVIGATCIWCLTSAVIITFLFWVSTNPVRKIWSSSEENIT